MNEIGQAELLDRVDDAEVAQVCQQLIRIPSVNPPGEEGRVAEFVAAYLAKSGLETEILPHTPGRASVLARLKGSGGAPGLLFSAHLDTVPADPENWMYPPFAGVLADGKVWGRGASDMKGGLAAMIATAKYLASAGLPLRGDLVLALTAGEEIDSLGAEAVVSRPELRSMQAIIVSEPSYNDIYIAEKGALWLEVTTHGRTAHGAMPGLGLNAVMMMVRFLTEFDQLEIPAQPHPMMGSFSRSVNTMQGGVVTNSVPDRCTATIDLRTVPGQEHAAIVAKIEALIGQLSEKESGFRASLRVTNDRAPIATAPEHPAVQQFNTALATVRGKPAIPKGVRYYTDAAVYVPALDLAMIICGPGEAGMAHQIDECVEVAKLGEATRIYLLACASMLA